MAKIKEKKLKIHVYPSNNLSLLAFRKFNPEKVRFPFK